MNTYAKIGEWSSLTARKTPAGVILEKKSRISGDIGGCRILFKGAELPKNDDELFLMWDMRDRGVVLRKGGVVR